MTTAERTATDRPRAEQWRPLGTQARVAVTRPDALAPAVRIARQRLDAVDRTCSRFRDDSELRALDACAGRPVQVSPLLAEAIAVALRAARMTDGDVDPTLGGALADAGYDRDFAQVRDGDTDPGVVVVRRRSHDWRAIVLDRDEHTLTLAPGTRLDLGATAKAWTADRIAHDVARRLDCGVLVSLGGDVAVAGRPPEGGWRVRVQDVTGDVEDTAAGPTTTVTLTSGGLASSGTTARRWTRGGAPMHHIIDPRTDHPAVTPWRTVSVAAGSCLDANTASTAALTRGEAALSWLERLGLPARLVARDGAVSTTARWPRDAA